MKRATLITLYLGSAVLVACAGSGEPTDDTTSIDELVDSIPDLPVADAEPKTAVDCDQACPADGQEGALHCEYQRYREGARFDSVVAFQPDSTALWPGSLVRGDDATHGVLSPISLARAPLGFSVSLENLVGSPAGTMTEPSLSAFRQARNQILAQGVSGATPAAIDFTISEVYNSSQLAIELGASVDWPGGAPIGASFEFESSESKTRILVNYTQAYYTIDVDPPERPAALFDPAVTADDLAAFVAGDSPPLYVQSITYGRRVLFSVESSEEASRVRAALEAAFNAGVNIGVDIDVAHERTLRESTIHAFVLGGAGSDAVGVIAGFDGLVRYLENGGDYSQESPGAPIAYRLAYLDNRPAAFGFTSEYTERTCVRNRATMRAELTSIDHVGGGDNGGNVELYGTIGMRVPRADDPVLDCDTGGELVMLWQLDEGQWISVPELTSWTPSTALATVLDDVDIGDSASLCLFADIWEEDYSTGELSGDDHFGASQRLIPSAHGWSGEQVLQPRGAGENAIDVRISIELE